VVTGGSNGIGRACVARLVDDGAAVTILDLVEPRWVALDDARAPSITYIHCDVSDEASVRSAAAEVLSRHATVDTLVNDAGGALFATMPFDEMSLDQWDRVVRVNLTGAWLCARAFAPTMRARGQGSIINFASAIVYTGFPAGLAGYAAAKGGVVGLTHALARELGGDGIRVNAVAPGYVVVSTPKPAVQDVTSLAEHVTAQQCLTRRETPEDVAAVVSFLASADAGFISGQVLSVDGGWTAR
jgi:3-oxoacyl-[acyl-carrier protein] reductase